MKERKIALYDIDRTSYQGLLIIDFVGYQVSTGTLKKKTLDEIINEEKLHKEGKPYEDMAQDMLDHWAKGLKGKKVSTVENEVNKFFKIPEGNRFFPFTRESIDLFRPTYDTYFVTAEPDFVAKKITTIHQATKSISTIFETKNGVFTGGITSSLAKNEDKGAVVKQLMETHLYKDSFAFGDSDGDTEMLEGVEYPICVNPNAELAKIRDEKGWKKIGPDEIVTFIKNVLSNNR